MASPHVNAACGQIHPMLRRIRSAPHTPCRSAGVVLANAALAVLELAVDWPRTWRNARGLIHPNPATGKPYVEIRKQWNRLVAIASRMLGYELTGRKADLFTFRHTGATDMASKARDGSDILDVVYMMGDTNIRTVEKHYFNFRRTRTAAMITGWDLPRVELQPVAPVMAA